MFQECRQEQEKDFRSSFNEYKAGLSREEKRGKAEKVFIKYKIIENLYFLYSTKKGDHEEKRHEKTRIFFLDFSISFLQKTFNTTPSRKRPRKAKSVDIPSQQVLLGVAKNLGSRYFVLESRDLHLIGFLSNQRLGLHD
jgi:hypothetical protein